MELRKQNIQNILPLLFFVCYVNSYDKMSGDTSMVKFMNEEEGSGVPDYETLAMFEDLLSNLQSTDLLVMVDVCEAATEFLEKLKKISKDAVKCMKHFSTNRTSVAVMTFSSNTSLIIDFDDTKCIEDDQCLLSKGREIKIVKEKRNLKRALRKAQKLFNKRKEKTGRKKIVLLITYGVDQIKDNFANNSRNKYITDKVSQKFKNDNITLAVVGVGEEAMENEQFFKTLLMPQNEEYLLLSKDGYILEILQMSVKLSCHAAYDTTGFAGFGYL